MEHFGVAHLRRERHDDHPTPQLPVDRHLAKFVGKLFARSPCIEKLKIRWVVDFGETKLIFRTFDAIKTPDKSEGFSSSDEVVPNIFVMLEVISEEIVSISQRNRARYADLVFVPDDPGCWPGFQP